MYLFAFTIYGGPMHHTPTYYGVGQDFKIFTHTDWPTFYKETNRYCKPIHLACVGTYKHDEDQEIYRHPEFGGAFIIIGDYEAIKVLDPVEDIIYFEDDGKDGEELYRAQFS
jgi:hypothetical protein